MTSDHLRPGAGEVRAVSAFDEARAACIARWGPPSWADAGALPRAAWSWGRGASRVMLIGQPGRLRLDLTDDDAESVGEPWQQWTITSEAAMTAVIARAGEYMATHGGEPTHLRSGAHSPASRAAASAARARA